jgi:sulfite reductase (NADPH) hemoprotein beta-component
MSAIDDKTTLGRARLSFADEAEIDEFVGMLERFERGELSPDKWRVFRLTRGTYGQRQPGDVQMLRVRIPQGILTAPQLYALAEIAETYSRGFGHITTRQNMQFHFVRLHDVELAMRRLADAGLTTREACGSAVRNITACPYAGVSPDEVFDVTPYADALTRHLLRHPLSSSLPRKFKIAFEGCSDDHAFTAINDIGFRARVLIEDGHLSRGFRVTAGGGTSIMCRNGGLLCEFLPAGEILEVAEAIIRVFHRFGDYEHKQRNRMKFLIKQLGWDGWRAEVDRARDAIRLEGGLPLPFDPDAGPVEAAPDWELPASPSVLDVASRVEAARVIGPGIVPRLGPRLPVLDDALGHWVATNVRPQRQPGYSLVTVRVPLGDLTGEQMRVLGDLAEAYGDGTVRTTHNQDVLFRWVATRRITELYHRLAAARLAAADANTAADVSGCPGAESCKLAVTQSRGLGRELGAHLEARPDLVAAAPGLSIKVSGCPNGCGLHHVAGIGFQGSVRKLESRVVPQYFLMVGGGFDDAGASFARLVAKIPARRAAAAVERLVALYRDEAAAGEEPDAFFRRSEREKLHAVVADLEHLDLDDATPEDFVDLGEEHEYRPDVQEGECSV